MNKSELKEKRNSIDAQRREALKKHLIESVTEMVENNDIRCFAVAAIDSNGCAHCLWDTGSIMPMWGFPEAMSSIINTDVSQSGVADTWKPSLPIRG